MTQARDDSQLDPQLRGADVSRRYRQLPVDTVPIELDRLVLDHARVAVGQPPEQARPSWLRWALPLGFAASAVLATVLILEDARAPQRDSAAVAIEAPASTAVPMLGSRAQPVMTAPSAAAANPPVRSDGDDTPRPSIDRALAAPPSIEPALATAEEPASIDANPSLPSASLEPASFEPTGGALLPETQPSASADVAASGPATVATLPEPQAHPVEAEPETAFEGLDVMSMASGRAASKDKASRDKERMAESRLEDIRHLRQTGRKRLADLEWRRFLKDFPAHPVAADDVARPVAQ